MPHALTVATHKRPRLDDAGENEYAAARRKRARRDAGPAWSEPRASVARKRSHDSLDASEDEKEEPGHAAKRARSAEWGVAAAPPVPAPAGPSRKRRLDEARATDVNTIDDAEMWPPRDKEARTGTLDAGTRLALAVAQYYGPRNRDLLGALIARLERLALVDSDPIVVH